MFIKFFLLIVDCFEDFVLIVFRIRVVTLWFGFLFPSLIRLKSYAWQFLSNTLILLSIISTAFFGEFGFLLIWGIVLLLFDVSKWYWEIDLVAIRNNIFSSKRFEHKFLGILILMKVTWLWRVIFVKFRIRSNDQTFWLTTGPLAALLVFLFFLNGLTMQRLLLLLNFEAWLYRSVVGW